MPSLGDVIQYIFTVLLLSYLTFTSPTCTRIRKRADNATAREESRGHELNEFIHAMIVQLAWSSALVATKPVPEDQHTARWIVVAVLFSMIAVVASCVEIPGVSNKCLSFVVGLYDRFGFSTGPRARDEQLIQV